MYILEFSAILQASVEYIFQVVNIRLLHAQCKIIFFLSAEHYYLSYFSGLFSFTYFLDFSHMIVQKNKSSKQNLLIVLFSFYFDSSHFTSGSLPVHFRFNSGSLPVHNFAEFVDIHMDIRKKVTSKDPFCVYALAQDLKHIVYWYLMATLKQSLHFIVSIIVCHLC